MSTDRDLVQASVNSSKAKKASAEYMLEDTRRNLRSDADGLVEKQKDAQRVFDLAKALEKLQTEKLENEQKQHSYGRSTTYQLLMFSQDLAQAELARIRAAYNLQMIQAQLAQYKGDMR
jgi:outer membrane protein TolC